MSSLTWYKKITSNRHCSSHSYSIRRWSNITDYKSNNDEDVVLEDSFNDDLILTPGNDEHNHENKRDHMNKTNNSSPSTQSVKMTEPDTQLINILANKIKKHGNLKRISKSDHRDSYEFALLLTEVVITFKWHTSSNRVCSRFS